jgi:light-regulated signal transduction histidine kinase (bacteriophytochrome)
MNDIKLNKLLQKQITKKLGNAAEVPPHMHDLCKAVSDTYDHFEREMQLIERSMDLSSEEMKETYDKLEQQKSQLQFSNEALKQYAYIVSHDLKEPLRTISSYMQLIEMRLKDRLDEETKEYMDFAVSGVKRMKGMLEAILNYSQLETHVIYSPVSLEKALGSACQNLHEMITETRSTIVENEQLPMIKGHEFQLIQLFQNLIQNSIKFRGKDTPYVKFLHSRVGNKHIISVVDNGIGIPEQNRQQVFHMFKRLHTIDQYDGLGMGLAICKKIVDNHQGEISIDPDFYDGLKIDIKFNVLASEL